MVLILLNWIYILFVGLGMGNLFHRFLKNKPNLFTIVVSGLFLQMILVHIYAVFFPINQTFYGINFILAAVGVFAYGSTSWKVLNESLNDFKDWNLKLKISSVAISLLIWMQSSIPTVIIDNESYYLQSLKWLNEYGLVKGLANLHFFFGQMSGWHLLQSSLNFGFLNQPLNDLNGFLLLIFTLFSINHLSKYHKEKRKEDLFLGLIPVLNLFLFQFVTAPSPDLPVFLFSQIIFYLFYINFNEYKNGFGLILVLSLFMILVKITAFPILILPFILLIKHKLYKKEFKLFFVLSSVSLLLFMTKNWLISGYPFYPLTLFGDVLNPPDWAILKEITALYYNLTGEYAISSLSSEEMKNLTAWEFLKFWINEPGLRSVFNKLIIALLLVFPIFIRKNKALFWLYIFALIQFFILYFTSPQYRFFIPLIIGIGIFLLTGVLDKVQKFIFPVWVFLILLSAIPLFFSINLEKLKTSGAMAKANPTFKTDYIFRPAKNSQFDFKYKEIKEGNLNYYSPEASGVLFWLTGDGPLPSINRPMVEYFKKEFGIHPQMRTENLSDGFRAEKIQE